MSDTPEDWVLIEAAKRGGFNPDLRSLRSMYAGDGLWKATFRALCDMIAKHEQAAAEERAKIVAWLQTNADPIVRNWISAQIEAKEHLK